MKALRFLLGAILRRLPGRHVLARKFDQGRIRMVVDLDDPIGLNVFRHGEPTIDGSPDPELRLLRELLASGDSFIDVGANLGLFSLVAASSVGPTGSVLACEPNVELCQRLRASAELNGFRWLQVEDCAVADVQGIEEFTVLTGAKSGFSSFRPPENMLGRKFPIRVMTLDALASNWRISGPRLVKIDVEGAEVRVLKGAAELLHAYRPDLLVEVEASHLGRQGYSPDDIAHLLEPLGYRPYRLIPGSARLGPAPDWRTASGNPNVLFSCHSYVEGIPSSATP